MHEIITISYPNSGRTWMKSMTNYLQWKISYNHMGSHIESNIPMEKYINHYNRYSDKFKNIDIIFLSRDPRDVIVSNYFQFIWRHGGGKNKDTISIYEFIKRENTSFEKILKYNLFWKKHNKTKIHITYESMLVDCFSELSKIKNTFQLDSTDIKIRETIDLFCFEKMKQREISKDNSYNKTKAFELLLNRTIQNEPESFKSRKGVAGGFVDYLDNDCIEFLNSKLKEYDYFESMSV